MSRSTAKELTRDERMQGVVVKALEDGWEAELTANGHIKFTHPYVDTPIYGPSSPSDYRSPKNTRSKLKSTLRQAVDEKMKDLGSDPAFAKDIDEALDEYGSEGLFQCAACFGQGKKKGFMSAQALAAHMSKQHPATPLSQEPDTEEDDMDDMKSATDTTGVSELEALQRMSELFRNYCHDHANEPFTMDDVIEELRLPNTREVRRAISNRVTTAKKRRQRHPRRRQYLESPQRGVYRYVIPNEPTHEPVAPVVKVEEREAERTPTPSGRLYEWVTETTDGRHIVKDDQGKVYFATFTEL